MTNPEDPAHAPSLPLAIAEANESGWYLYQLYQEESLTEWGCTLRALTGPPRREISRGTAADPVLAIYHALGSAPELEREVSSSPEPGAPPRRGIAEILGRRQPTAVLRRI